MGRFKSFPKTSDGKIDKERVKDQYLSGPDYVWKDFCAKHRYNPDLRREFPIVAWHAEWQGKKLEAEAELLTKDALELRTQVLHTRTESIRLQLGANNKLRRLFDRTLLAAEQASEAPSSRELLALAGVERLIQKCEFESLLMTAQVCPEPIQFDNPHIQVAEDSEGERLRAIAPALINGESLDEDRMTAILDKWIDQSTVNSADTEADQDPDDLNRPLDPTEID